MTMITDEERREVARRLRETGEELGSGALLWYHIAKALGVRTATDGKTACGMLADLIEPEPERTCRDTDHNTESITCSKCGEITRETLFWVDVDGGETVKGHRPRFCSNCGARVVDDARH